MKTRCHFIREDWGSGEATTAYHDVKIQMQPCHLFILIKNCDFLRFFPWTFGVYSLISWRCHILGRLGPWCLHDFGKAVEMGAEAG